MDLVFTAEERAFRDEVRTWLEENKPREVRPEDGARAIRDFDTAWQRTQYDGGWAGVAWPKQYGGRGLSLVQSLIWLEEYGRQGLPGIDSCFVGLAHAGPTLIARANEEQKAYHLPKILTGEVIWSQGFSEPEAGSDLASLQTRAEIDGDQLVITGQKIWTSFADIADWQEMLVRTDRDAPKHKGISWVIVDMNAPGIDKRPIRTMDGGAEFCEVFYDEVRVPISNVVGDINDGWSVAMSTLSFERGTAFTVNQVRLAKEVEDLIELANVRKGPDGRRAWIHDDEMARRLGEVRAEVASMRAMTYMGVSRGLRSSTPGPEGSMLKLYYSELQQKVGRIAIDMMGDDGVEFVSRWIDGGWTGIYLGSFSSSIGGGTSEIQRNIIGERVLGLPR
jgi:alkylation response protein AidB-like acyl-CoA dehydrogenase